MNMTQFSNWNEEIKLFVTKHKEVPPTATSKMDENNDKPIYHHQINVCIPNVTDPTPASTICASCGASPKVGCTFSHHSPDSHLINQYMCNIDATKIQPSDRLCLLCYKHHLSIISHLNDQSVSYDSSLLEYITKVILETVIFVAQRLFENKALLLSTACIAFLEKYSDESHETEINS
jgi:hypothetical protein